ncbi:MAG: hypothetical protein U0736_06010 [Gemmataceae bacterium]
MPFAMVGAAGGAILFVCLFVLCVPLAAYTLLYALHCYRVTVQGTVAGIDRVEWPNEPPIDLLIGGLPTLALLAVCLIPVGLIGRALPDAVLPDRPTGRVLLVLVPFAWLVLPLGLLSALASSSRWMPLSGQVLLGLARLVPALVVFYAVTAVLIAALLALAAFTLLVDFRLVPVATAGAAALWLIHARLVGRIGWLLHRVEMPAPPPRPRPAVPKRRRRRATVHDPWAVPDEDDEPPAHRPSSGYRVMTEDDEAPPPRPSYLGPEPEPYTLATPDESSAEESAREPVVPREVLEREVALRTREPPNPPPAYPLVSGVYTYPAYPTTRRAWFYLTLAGSASAVLVRATMSLWPG